MNTLGFHEYGEEISQNCPSSLYPINTSFLGTLPPTCHSTPSKRIFLAAASFEKLKNSSKDPFQRFFESSISSSSREEMAINFVVPDVNSVSLFFFLPYFRFFARLFTWYFLSFFLFFFLKPLGIGRENCYSHRSTPLSMPWSVGKSRSYRFDKCRNK